MKKEQASKDTQFCLPAEVLLTSGDKIDLVVRLFLSDSRTPPTNSSFSYV